LRFDCQVPLPGFDGGRSVRRTVGGNLHAAGIRGEAPDAVTRAPMFGLASSVIDINSAI
jgi:hypothetical protein